MKKIKKIKEKLNKNIMLGISLLVLGLVTGIGILSTGYNILASVNPFNLVAGDVTYTNNSQSTVQGAIDELFNKSNTWIDPSCIDIKTLKTNTNKTILASSAGMCIKRNNKVSCFKPNNWAEEQNHIQQVYSDVGSYNSSTGLGCNVNSDGVDCFASDFYCYVLDDGRVDCSDRSDGSGCIVNSAGSVYCY